LARSGLQALAALVILACGLALTALGAGCAPPCCTVDSEPIPVSRAPLGQGTASGALLALARLPGGGAPFPMVVDTASPATILSGPPKSGQLEIETGGFDLLDANDPAAVRARFRNLGLFSLPLGPVGDAATLPLGVLGGDLMHAFSMEMRFAKTCPGAAPDAGPGGPTSTCSSVTFWTHQGASESFLEDAGYAVLQFALYGGGETTASSQPGFLGLSAPVTLPATRIVLRACGAPRAFSTDEMREACCTRGDELARATGVDLALLLATGVGPMVLSQQAWLRLAAKLTPVPPVTAAPLFVASWPLPIAAEWTTIPRFALVDGSDPPSTGDQGPCVDLGRARRIAWATTQTSKQVPFSAHAPVGACVQPCDTDPAESDLALNSPAYLEINGSVPVAVVDDAEPFLQALRFDIRPEGPDIDGLVGAAALGAARLEVDYLNDPPRAIFSCEPNVGTDACYASSRCPRLPNQNDQHLCFGLPEQGLPVTCAPNGCP
jgi:hypothetical protein